MRLNIADRHAEVHLLPEPEAADPQVAGDPAGPPDVRIVAPMSAGPPIPSAPVTSVAEAIARMEAIGAGLPAGDGLACFNRMYLAVTQTVGADIGQGSSPTRRS